VTPESPTSVGEPSAMSRHATWIILTVVFVVLAGLVGLIVWALGSSGSASAPRPGFERYQPAWESAMRKAGVEATFPDGPVDISQVRATGTQPLDATFTAEEVAALLSVYRYEARVSGQTAATGDIEVSFPEDGVAELDMVLYWDGSRYRAKAVAPLAYQGGTITSPGLTSLRVAGFSVSGSNKEQASDGIIDYLNRYLGAAPGLTVEEAAITTDGLAVKGTVPESIEHPDPVDG
jgi:hypothetical protein